MGIKVGDTYKIEGVAFEVIDEHDGHYTLAAGDREFHFTAKQLKGLRPVQHTVAVFVPPDQFELHDSGLER